MVELALHYVNLLLIVSCAIMSLLFFFQPIPKLKGLTNYRIALRLLALSYLSLAVLTILDMRVGIQTINYPIALTATSLQSILFFFALVSLLNIQFARRELIAKILSPTVAYVVLLLIFSAIFGTPSIGSFYDLKVSYTHPTVVLNLLFMLFCIVQLLLLSLLIKIQVRKYEARLNDYYANTYKLHLVWVRYLFTGAFVFALVIIVSLIFNSTYLSVVVTLVNSVFYVVFGLFYIRYPLIYRKIEPVVKEVLPIQKDSTSEVFIKKNSWEELKCRIVEDKLYLQPELNIEQLSELLRVGRTTLSNFINREEGVNFYTWINTLRIEEAKQIIINNPSYSFATVAEMVGISEASNFSRQFKQATKQSPSVWKAEQLSSMAKS